MPRRIEDTCLTLCDSPKRMPDLRRKKCRECHRYSDVAGPISWSGHCLECAEALLTENIEGLAAMTGHVRDRWARGMILSAGGILPDRLQVRS